MTGTQPEEIPIPSPTRKTYWIDDFQGKHELYSYTDSDSRIVTVEHEGRLLSLLIPETIPLTAFRATAASGEYLFLLGEQLDEEDAEFGIIEGGDGVAMIARRHPSRPDTYWLFVRHSLYSETLDRLDDPADVAASNV